MNVITAGVPGTMYAGGGHKLLKDICITLNILMVSSTSYQNHVEILSPHCDRAALDEIMECGRVQYKAAVEACDIDTAGTLIITVVTDGSCQTRS
jgi:hypothetical protein